jgi:hypothetical protein
MNKLRFVLIALASTGIAACVTTDTGTRKVDTAKVCNVATLASVTVQDIADVLIERGIAADKAVRIASAAHTAENAANFVCPFLVAAGK